MASNRRKHTVLITGASSDIGKVCAGLFAQSGYRVLCHYNTENDNIRQLKQNFKKNEMDPVFLKADFTSKRELEKFVSKLGVFKIDTLVNNAGTYTIKKHFTQLSLSDLEKTFMVNVYAPLLITSGVFSQMKKMGFGRIVNISSIASKYGGSAESMHYGASKRALEGITKTIAAQGASYNVYANTIRPGVIDTDFHKKFPKDMSKRIEMIPVKKMGLPSDIAEMAFYLGSEKNSFITNQVVTVSGGE